MRDLTQSNGNDMKQFSVRDEKNNSEKRQHFPENCVKNMVLPRVPTDGRCENNPLFFKHMGTGVPSKKEATITFIDRILHFLPFREWMRSFHDHRSKKPFILSM
jgi:hypothetical protein